MLLVNIVLGIANYYVLLTHLLISKRKGYTIIHVAIYVGAGAAAWAPSVLTYLIYKHSSIVESVNKFLAMKQRIAQGRN